MEIRETSRTRSPILLQQERIGLQVDWLLTAVGRAYLAFCPGKERQRVINMLRSSPRPEDHLAREPEKLNAILAATRERGYGTRDPSFVGGYYGSPPIADGLLAIAVPLREARAFLERSICFGCGRPTASKRSRIDTCPTCRWQRRRSLTPCESGHVAERLRQAPRLLLVDIVAEVFLG